MEIRTSSAEIQTLLCCQSHDMHLVTVHILEAVSTGYLFKTLFILCIFGEKKRNGSQYWSYGLRRRRAWL